MLKTLFFINFIFFANFYIFSQNDTYKDNPFYPKNNITKGDTLWLFGKYEIYKWEENLYKPSEYYFLYTYYTNSSNIKTIKFVNYKKDTLFKYDYFYDSLNRRVKDIRMDYDSINNSWTNSSKAEYFFTMTGLDSLTLIYVWDNNDSLWKNNYMKIKIWNTFGYIKYQADSIWLGSYWKILGGYEYEYLYNEYNQVLEERAYSYNPSTNQWVYDYKNEFSIINPETGEYDTKLVYKWDNINNVWNKYLRFSEIVLHNWNGFPYLAPEYEYSIMEYWQNNSWTYMKKDSIIYDSLGGSVWYYFIYNNDGAFWEKKYKTVDEFNESGYQISYYTQIWQNNQWNNYSGITKDYYFDGPKLKEVIQDEWDTVSSQWIHSRKYIYGDYIYFLLNNEYENEIYDTNLHIIPNPSKNSIKIKLNETDRIKTVKVYNVAGQRILNKNFHGQRMQESLNISVLKNGIYIINVTKKNGKTLSTKFIKN